MSQLKLFDPIRTQVQIRQKTVKHTLADKLYDAFISLLAGAHGLVEINTRLRTDPALQHAFGRKACAKQSVVQETLDACTGENVSQMQHSFDEISRSHSQGFRHDYQASLQVLDVDMSGRHPPLLPRKGTLPGNITVEGGKWAASWPRTMRKWSSIASLPAMSS